MKKFLQKNWLLVVILIIAAFLRLYKITDYMEFLGDQGRDVVIVRDFLQNGNLFFIGPQTSIGNMYLGPFYYYVIVAPALLLAWFNPVGPAVFVALLGVATVALLFFICQKWFDKKTAIVAAFLYAISPVVIKYSDFSWNPNVMPIFALLFIYFMTEKRYFLASLAFVMCLNSHFLALLLLPVALIIWLVNSPKKYLKETFLAVFVFILSLTPQVLFDIKHHGQNIKAIAAFFTERQTTVNLKVYKSLPIIPSLFNQINTRILAGKNETFGLILSIIFILGLVYLFFKLRRLVDFKYYLLGITWYLCGLLGLGLYKQHIYDHYFGFLFPVVFMLMALLISRLPRILAIPLIISLTIFSILQNPFRWTAPKQLATTIQIDQSVLSKSNQQPFNFSLLAKQNYDQPYRYFFYQWHSPVVTLDQQITDQLFVVCEPFQIDCNPINNPEWSVAAFGWAKIDSQWEINGIKIFRLVHNPNGQKQN
jgi:4-amino-4-deoxy-L-arabinose transferase-like glycosyltransferase